MMESQVMLSGQCPKAAAPHCFALHLGIFFVPRTENTNWNYTEKSAGKTTRHAALTEISSLRFWVFLKKKKKRENAVNAESTEDKGHQRASLHQSPSAKFHTN